MENKYKYNLGDVVNITKKLSPEGRWENIPLREAKIADIKYTASFGPAYVLEINGERCNICYWESDIDGLSEIEKKNDCNSDPK